MTAVLANRPNEEIFYRPLWGGLRTAYKLARLTEHQGNQSLILRPQRIATIFPESRRLMDAIAERGGRKITLDPNSTTWDIFKKLYLPARFGSGFASSSEFETDYIINYFRNIEGKEDPDPGLESYIREIVKLRTNSGNDTSASVIVNGVIDFLGEVNEEDRLVGLKIGDEVRVTSAWFKKFRGVYSYSETHKAFKDFIRDYHYGFTFPTRLANLTAVIANTILGRTAFNRKIVEETEKLQCDTIYFDPHFGTGLPEIELKIPFSPQSRALRIIDIGCGTSRAGSVTLKYLTETLKTILGRTFRIKSMGIDINYPTHGLYPVFRNATFLSDHYRLDSRYSFEEWETVYSFNIFSWCNVGDITYFDANNSEYNVVSDDFTLGERERYDVAVCSMLLLDFPGEKQETIRNNIFSLIQPGGILFLNATSKDDAKSWEYFEIWYRDRDDGEMKVLDQVIPFEDNPYTSKFQVDFIIEGGALVSPRQYAKRGHHLLYAYRRAISQVIELAKRYQKRGSSVWGNILAAQRKALKGGTINEVLAEIIGSIDDPGIKSYFDEYFKVWEKHATHSFAQAYNRLMFTNLQGEKLSKEFHRTDVEERERIGEPSGLWLDKEENVHIDDLELPFDFAYSAFQILASSYNAFHVIASLLVRDLSPQEIKEYFEYANSKAPGSKKEENTVQRYVNALSRIRALASAFAFPATASSNFIPDFLKLLNRYSTFLFPAFREDRKDIVRLFTFSRFLDLWNKRREKLSAEELLELKYVLAPLAEYLENPNLSRTFRKIYFENSLPEECSRITDEIKEIAGLEREERHELFQKIKLDLEERIAIELGLRRDEFEVSYREKEPYSIYLKLKDEAHGMYEAVEDLKDLFGIRVVVRDRKLIKKVAKLIRQFTRGATDLSPETRDRRKRLLDLMAKGAIAPEGFVIPEISDSNLDLYSMVRFEQEHEIPIEFQVTTFDNVPAMDMHWAFKLRREIANDPEISAPQTVDPLMLDGLFLDEFILYQEIEVDNPSEEIEPGNFKDLYDRSGTPFKIKTFPKGAKIKDFQEIFIYGYEVKVYNAEWDFENGRERLVQQQLSRNKEEYLKTGQIVVALIPRGKAPRSS